MRVVLLGNGAAAVDAASAIVESGDRICGFVAHPPERERCVDEIARAAKIDPQEAMPGSRIASPEGIAWLERLQADIAVSVYFGYILPRRVLDLFPAGAINLHPGLLPYNRGAYTNVWSIIDRTPAGVTLHYMDEGVDTGDIIDQQEVEVEPIDTGETLHRKLEIAAGALFRRAWPLVREGKAGRWAQSGTATTHRGRDVDAIDSIDLDRLYPARDLIDILRARTFPPHRGAYFEVGGRRVSVRVQLSYEPDTQDDGTGP